MLLRQPKAGNDRTELLQDIFPRLQQQGGQIPVSIRLDILTFVYLNKIAPLAVACIPACLVPGHTHRRSAHRTRENSRLPLSKKDSSNKKRLTY